MKEQDITQHVIEAHTAVEIPKHTKGWYEVWGNKCPQAGCQAVAEFSL